MAPLNQVVSRSLIVCYREEVGDLEELLASSGLVPQVLRGSYSAAELEYPAAKRTLLNHRRAWQIAADVPGYTLICEADFVPCRGFGDLPAFWPTANPLAWGYMYQGSPRLLAIVGPQRYLRGHCAPLVAYVVNKLVAAHMLRFFECKIGEYGTKTYVSWDAQLQWWTMGQGAEAYIPLRHYGEHGGLPNPEHARSGLMARAGRHRADNLIAPLAFLPQYAGGSRVTYWKERSVARALGFGRLFTGRWIVDSNVYPRTLKSTLKMYWIGFRRLFW